MNSILPFQCRNFIMDPFHALRQEIDRLFEVSTSVQGCIPEFETKENKNGLEVTAELPGVSEGDIDISLSDGILTISGEKKSEETKNGETYHIIERRYGAFSRSLKLPYEPEEKDISASFKNRVLKVVIPRPKELKSNIYKIQVQS
ncbi:MAG: Hsp20/alpha crystallin family protein [Proteobacteria bacterium]|nr:Hsp20/alpha crystallin family protein [Pseudomonadota bacterium]